MKILIEVVTPLEKDPHDPVTCHWTVMDGTPPGNSGVKAQCGPHNTKIHLFTHLCIHSVNACLFVARYLALFVTLLSWINMKETGLIIRELPLYYTKHSRTKQ